jgi:hypothetical protein
VVEKKDNGYDTIQLTYFFCFFVSGPGCIVLVVLFLGVRLGNNFLSTGPASSGGAIFRFRLLLLLDRVKLGIEQIKYDTASSTVNQTNYFGSTYLFNLVLK